MTSIAYTQRSAAAPSAAETTSSRAAPQPPRAKTQAKKQAKPPEAAASKRPSSAWLIASVAALVIASPVFVPVMVVLFPFAWLGTKIFGRSRSVAEKPQELKEPSEFDKRLAKVNEVRAFYAERGMPTPSLKDISIFKQIKEQDRLSVIADLPLGKLHSRPQAIPRAQRAAMVDDKRAALDALIVGEDPIKDAMLDGWALYQSGRPAPYLALAGGPGTGKSTLLGTGLTALYDGRPSYVVSLGGCAQEGRILGWAPSYQSAAPGAIVTALRSTQVMDPVIIFDELDHTKSEHGDFPVLEAISNLLESTPPNARGERWFVDQYLGDDIKIDISKITFAFTFNDLEKLKKQCPQLVSRLGTLLETTPLTAERLLAVGRQMLAAHDPEKRFHIADEDLSHLVAFATEHDLPPRSLREGLRALVAVVNRRSWAAANDGPDQRTIRREDVDAWCKSLPRAALKKAQRSKPPRRA